MMPLHHEMNSIYQEVLAHFSADAIQELASASGFIRRKRKLTAMDSLLLFVFTSKQLSDASLEQLSDHLFKLTGKQLSGEAINQRMNWQTVSFLQAILKQLLQTKCSRTFQKFTKYSTIFEKIRILDSTAFQIPDTFADWFPGTGCTSVKFQIEFEVFSGQFTHVHFEPGRVHDAKTGNALCETVQPKELILRDLGYLNLEELEKLSSQEERYFISRLRNNAKVYRKNPHPSYWANGNIQQKTAYISYSIQELAETLEVGETKEFEGIYVGKGKVKMPIRLIITHFTPVIRQQRAARMKEIERVSGRHYQEKTKQMASYGFYITNLPREIEKEDIYPLYSLRWQIELLFKSWKSTMKLTHCKPMKIERLICHFYTQMIRLILCTLVTYQMRYVLWEKSQKELSEMKGFKYVFDQLEMLYGAMQKSAECVVESLIHIFHRLERNGIKSRKKDKPTFQQLIGTL